MSLLYGQDLLDNQEFFLFIDLVKRGVTARNMKPVYDNPASQNQFFFITLASRERIFFKPFQGSFDYPS
jgi:hypothetical protein